VNKSCNNEEWKLEIGILGIQKPLLFKKFESFKKGAKKGFEKEAFGMVNPWEPGTFYKGVNPN